MGRARCVVTGKIITVITLNSLKIDKFELEELMNNEDMTASDMY